MPLRLIGYWKSDLADEYPFPQELRTEYSAGLGDRLVAYLESGGLFVGYRGHSWCRFGCPGGNGSAELTDGSWVWPEGLAHYVRHHPVALPDDFVRDVTATNRRAGLSRGHPRTTEVDDSYWIGWARSYRTTAVGMLIEEARAAASRTFEAMLEATAMEITAQEGVGPSSCLMAGCGRQAIAGKVFCGRCLAERNRDSLRLAAEARELGRVMRLLPGVLAN